MFDLVLLEKIYVVYSDTDNVFMAILIYYYGYYVNTVKNVINQSHTIHYQIPKND